MQRMLHGIDRKVCHKNRTHGHTLEELGTGPKPTDGNNPFTANDRGYISWDYLSSDVWV